MAKQIVCDDALDWLQGKRDVGTVVTSLPDADEIGIPIDEWREWFHRAAGMCIAAASPDAPVLFYQTDRKAEGVLESKARLVLNAAADAGAHLLWHKIVLRRGVGATDLFRPTYTHLLAVSVNGRPGAALPDVIESGHMLYPNAMGLTAAAFAVRYATQKHKRLVDPFCGRGTIPAVAEAFGCDVVGVDIDPEQCQRAEALQLRRSN